MGVNPHVEIWLALRNAREVVAGLTRTAVATRALGSSVDRLARHMDRAGRRTFLMNQAIFTLRRYSYMFTLAITAGAIAVAKWGFDYNSQVQNARVALTQFGFTQGQINKQIQTMYRLAAISPFLFTDITQTTRRFLAFGMSLVMANTLTTNLVDALTALGLANTASINRASLALAHMYSLGRLTGQVVYQLARDNVPIIQALETELHLTGEQLRNVGRLGIPAAVAINALNKYISETPRFHGAALRFATRTWQGIVTTTRDYMAQFLGQIERPLFFRLQRQARQFLFFLSSPEVRRLSARGDVAGVLGAALGPNAARAWNLLSISFHSLWRILVGAVIPAFQTVAHYFFPVLYVLAYTLAHSLQFLSRHTTILKLFFGLLAFEAGVLAARYLILLPIQMILMGRMIAMNAIQRILIALQLARIATIDAETGAIIVNTAAEDKKILMLRFGTKWMRASIIWTKLSTFFTRLWTVAIYGNIRGQRGQFVAMTRLEKGVLRLRKAMLPLILSVRAYTLALWSAVRAGIVFLFTNPIGWAILAVALFGLLYWKVKRFRDAVNDLFGAIWRGSPVVSAAFAAMLGPIGSLILALRFAVQMFGQLKKHARDVQGFLPNLPGGFSGGVIRRTIRDISPIPIPGVSFPIPHERHQDTPNIRVRHRARSSTASTGFPELPIVIELLNKNELNVDGKKMAEAVSKHRLDATARR